MQKALLLNAPSSQRRIAPSSVSALPSTPLTEFAVGPNAAGPTRRMMLETTFALTDDGVISKWVLIDELPTTFTEVDTISKARHSSWEAWKRFQAIRIFGPSFCECPRHQQTDFCKHVAAARAYLGNLNAPPKEVISALEWNKRVNKKRSGDEREVLSMLRAESARDSRARSVKRQRSPSTAMPPLAPPPPFPSNGIVPSVSHNPKRSPLRVLPGNSDAPQHHTPKRAPSPRAIHLRSNALRSPRAPSPGPRAPSVVATPEMINYGAIKTRQRSSSRGFVLH